jgi:hypothetical protein
LKDLIRRSSNSVVIRAAGASSDSYTAAFVQQLERHSQFRFAFLRERRKEMARRGAMIANLFEAFLAGDDDEPAFPLLPSSLLPR